MVVGGKQKRAAKFHEFQSLLQSFKRKEPEAVFTGGCMSRFFADLIGEMTIGNFFLFPPTLFNMMFLQLIISRLLFQ